MGKRDFSGREAKKPKKQAKKASVETILPVEAPVEVEVIRKKHKKDLEAEEPGT
jgi:hypothetical protein